MVINTMIKEIKTLDQLEELVKESNEVIVDFWAGWCGPCRAMNPVFKQLTEDNDSLVIAKVNVDENQDLAATFKISSIPAMDLYKGGKFSKRIIGAHTLSQMKQEIS